MIVIRRPRADDLSRSSTNWRIVEARRAATHPAGSKILGIAATLAEEQVEPSPNLEVLVGVSWTRCISPSLSPSTARC